MIEMKLTRIVKFILNIIALLSLTIYFPASFAEPAPVYDADALEQPYENGGGEQIPQDLPPPPNQSNQDSAFIPIQSEMQPSAPPSGGGRGGLERRLQRVEQQISNMQSSELTAQIESLQNQIQSLRAELEQVTKTVNDAQKQQKSMYADIDARLERVSGLAQGKRAIADAGNTGDATVTVQAKSNLASSEPVATTAPKPGATIKVANNATKTAATPKAAADENQPDVAEEQQIYQNAYNMIKNKKYEDAVKILQSMLQKYPSGQFASNAHYWLGELYGLLGKNDKALIEFDQVVRNFSDSPRVSDAMLKVGLIFAAQSKWVDAKNIFKKVVNQYPGTASSRLANEQLKQIKQAGH